MVDDFESQEVRTSGELWSEICSGLPGERGEAAPENNTEFKDSFQPGEQVNGQSHGTNASSSSAKWEPMEDSEIYIASLGTGVHPISFMTVGLMLHVADHHVTHLPASIMCPSQSKLYGRLL